MAITEVFGEFRFAIWPYSSFFILFRAVVIFEMSYMALMTLFSVQNRKDTDCSHTLRFNTATI
jgi:hypothetical protein